MNKINIDGTIAPWNQNIKELRKQLEEMSGDLYVYISSTGGLVWHGIEMFNEFRNYSKGKTVCRIGAVGASMASYIPMAFDEVEVYDNTTFMIHNAWMLTWGDYIQLNKDADILKGLTTMLRKQYVQRTGKPDAAIAEKMNAESYFFGQEIMDYGFADRVIESGESGDRSAAVAMAQTAFREMKAEIRTHEMPEESEQVAAYLKQEGLMKQYENKSTQNQNKEKHMDLSQVTAAMLAEKRPDLVADIKKQGHDEGMTAGAQAERERIQGIEAIAEPGFEALVDEMKFDGESTAEQVEIAMFRKEKEQRKKKATAYEDDGKEIAALTAEAGSTTPPEGSEKKEEGKAEAKLLWAAAIDKMTGGK